LTLAKSNPVKTCFFLHENLGVVYERDLWVCMKKKI